MNYYVRCNPGKDPPVTVHEKKSLDADEVLEIPEGKHVLAIDTDNSSEKDFKIRVSPSLPKVSVSQGAARSLTIEVDKAGILLNLVAIVGASTPYETEGGKPIIRNGMRFTPLQMACVGTLAFVAGVALVLLLAMSAKLF
jgi:hypothetical protein